MDGRSSRADQAASSSRAPRAAARRSCATTSATSRACRADGIDAVRRDAARCTARPRRQRAPPARAARPCSNNYWNHLFKELDEVRAVPGAPAQGRQPAPQLRRPALRRERAKPGCAACSASSSVRCRWRSRGSRPSRRPRWASGSRSSSTELSRGRPSARAGALGASIEANDRCFWIVRFRRGATSSTRRAMSGSLWGRHHFAECGGMSAVPAHRCRGPRSASRRMPRPRPLRPCPAPVPAAAPAARVRPPPPRRCRPRPSTASAAATSCTINVYKEADLSKALQVRPDGRITLPLIGDLAAVGQTPMQLQRRVAELAEGIRGQPRRHGDGRRRSPTASST